MKSEPIETSPLETECLFGETVEILDKHFDWVYCKLETDNYCGWIKKKGLGKSKNPTSIVDLQKEVWGHNSKLETHTVETHIYRLRKKINNAFNDNNFIKSSKTGYII